ncbi:MAG TPA: DUF3619 family protein [Burkholderiales bacterium]|nr:DUF3619 family protein [Burkholderiales bacterium]
MNEQDLGIRIRTALDGGPRLAPDVVARLHVARERALERHAVVDRGFSAVAARRGGALLRLGWFEGSWAQVALSVAFLVTALAGVHFWYEGREAALAAAQATEEIVEVDTQVLTGDLPINAYLDEDFQSWLKQSSE